MRLLLKILACVLLSPVNIGNIDWIFIISTERARESEWEKSSQILYSRELKSVVLMQKWSIKLNKQQTKYKKNIHSPLHITQKTTIVIIRLRCLYCRIVPFVYNKIECETLVWCALELAINSRNSCWYKNTYECHLIVRYSIYGERERAKERENEEREREWRRNTKRKIWNRTITITTTSFRSAIHSAKHQNQICNL